MEMNEKNKGKEKPFNELSQEELLKKIDADALTDNHEEMKDFSLRETQFSNLLELLSLIPA